MCLAVVGALVAIATSKQQRVLVVALAVACLIVPLQQARIESGVSLDKHLSLGIWLASMAAGYGIMSLVRVPKSRLLMVMCSCALFIFPAIVGASAAQWSFQGWNNSNALVAAFNRYSHDAKGQIAVENSDDAVLRYYTSQGRNWATWAEKWTGIGLASVVGSVSAAQRAAGIAKYRQSLTAGNYGTVIVFFNQPDVYNLTQTTFATEAQGAGNTYNQEVVRLLANNPELTAMVDALLEDPEYRVTTVVPYGRDLSGIDAACVFWQRVPNWQKVRHSTAPKRVSRTAPKHLSRTPPKRVGPRGIAR
jgi:hypothetical protein